MMYIAALFVYPVKSCAGVALSIAQLTARGIDGDRELMLVDANAEFITQRDFPALALVQPSLQADTLRLQAPTLPELQLTLPSQGSPVAVRVWNSNCLALDCGAAAAEWFSTYLGSPCRLVRMMPGFVRPLNPKYSPTATAQTAFSDGYPLLLVNNASLAELNTRLAHPVSVHRFRPNIVLAGDQAAWAEDTWFELTTPTVTLRVVKPCARCVITTIDPYTLQSGPEPLRTLARYRRHPDLGVIFGQNVVHLNEGLLRVADPVTVCRLQGEN
jgi:uncharacterized protein YcbX